jgi:hypothetical protein
MKRISLVVLLGLAGANAAHAQFKSATLPELDVPAMQALMPVVKNIRVEPGTITIRVGQTVQLRTISVIAVDSSGKDRGRLSAYDFKILKGQPAEAVPRQITGKRPGTALLTVHYPTSAWKGRSDPRPEATVNVVVKP